MTPASTDLLESERFNQSNQIDKRHISDVTSKDASEEPTWSHDCDRIQRVYHDRGFAPRGSLPPTAEAVGFSPHTPFR
jgi:hypothetical protein